MHTFTPSISDSTKCGTCKRGFLDHTELATCECCPNVGKMELHVDILMCADCYSKQLEYDKQAADPQIQAQRVEESRERERIQALSTGNGSTGILNINNLIDKARTVDYTVQVRPDIFNAATLANAEVFASIDADDTIPVADKQFKKAEFIQDRQAHFQKVIFDANQQLLEANNHLRVLQSDLNKIVNTLRAEEREKLKLSNPEYKPGTVKSPKASTKARAPKKVKFDRKELIDQVAELVKEGLPATLAGIQGICTARDMTPKQAAAEFRKVLGGA